jgi:hypothetical protein
LWDSYVTYVADILKYKIEFKLAMTKIRLHPSTASIASLEVVFMVHEHKLQIVSPHSAIMNTNY